MMKDQVHKILGNADLEWLISAVRKRLERGDGIGERIPLPPNLGAEARDALSRVVGRRISESARSFSVNELEQILAQSGVPSLQRAVEALGGPLKNRREDRLKVQSAWKEIFSEARDRL
jgi:hypothetical protein